MTNYVVGKLPSFYIKWKNEGVINVIFVLILLIFFLSSGIYFIVKSKHESSNKGFYQWIGIALIVMALFFVAVGSYQIIDGGPDSGHYE